MMKRNTLSATEIILGDPDKHVGVLDSPDGSRRQAQGPRKYWRNCEYLLLPVAYVRNSASGSLQEADHTAKSAHGAGSMPNPSRKSGVGSIMSRLRCNLLAPFMPPKLPQAPTLAESSGYGRAREPLTLHLAAMRGTLPDIPPRSLEEVQGRRMRSACDHGGHGRCQVGGRRTSLVPTLPIRTGIQAARVTPATSRQV